ncbi:MAG: DNA repair protein RecO [Planctomycetes bacterium]|nr:DNA repair protein RecO [Planctomycetota bacterium]
MTVHKSSVLILQCQDWSETSQVVHILAREAGRLRCLAKGSRRGLNPFSGPLERWTCGQAVFSLTDPNRLSTLMELFETERFAGLREKLPAFYGASALTELILAIVPDAERQPELYDLAVESLRRLASADGRECPALTFAAILRVLQRLGYVSATDRCAECGRHLASGPADFSPGHGGPLCAACRPPAAIRAAARTREAVAFLLAAPWDEVRRVRLAPATAAQVREILQARLEELAGRKLASLRYV